MIIEAAVIAITGAILGLGAAVVLPIVTGFGDGGFLPGFHVTPGTLVFGAAVALLLTVASGVFPAAGREASRGAGAAEGRMKIPLIYNIRASRSGWCRRCSPALGIGLVVPVFVAMLRGRTGHRRAGEDRLGRQRAAPAPRRGQRAVERHPARGDQHHRVVAAHRHRVGRSAAHEPETYIVINIPRLGGTEFEVANVVARGVSDKALEVRRNIKVIEGRRFASGQSEICVGSKLQGRFNNVRVGDVLRFSNRDWKVVCRFTAEGSSFESEIWGENEQFQNVFRANAFQDVAFRLKDR